MLNVRVIFSFRFRVLDFVLVLALFKAWEYSLVWLVFGLWLRLIF